MTEQTSATTAKGYNMNVTVKGPIDETPAANGTRKIKFRGTIERNGKTIERTVLAQGAAADAVANVLKVGETSKLRILFSNVPTDDGSRGGEYLTVIGLPLPPKQKAA